MKSKTLKDIKPYMQGTMLAEFDLAKEKLKQIAISKVKWLIKNEKNHVSAREDIYAQGQVDVLAELFNITMEDLK